MRWVDRLAPALALALMTGAAAAASDAEISRLLAADKAPPGVVFEIVSGDARALEWAVPKVSGYAEKLRSRFPGLPIAVVTHGNEQFALQSDSAASFADLHRQVQGLSTKDNVPVHICGTYADRRGVAPEAFPKYVDVAPSGPSQIRGYRELGYVLVKVTR
ncbi:MAG TPA: DsrE family protein [Pelomicrobium sp.]|nr:DsrE family protein [Pelomicrobium sp.]